MARYFYQGDRETACWQEYPTGKRSYRSRKHAMEAHRKASYRLRAYLCHECSGWHTTHEER
jgi:hypothetical protein